MSTTIRRLILLLAMVSLVSACAIGCIEVKVEMKGKWFTEKVGNVTIKTCIPNGEDCNIGETSITNNNRDF